MSTSNIIAAFQSNDFDLDVKTSTDLSPFYRVCMDQAQKTSNYGQNTRQPKLYGPETKRSWTRVRGIRERTPWERRRAMNSEVESVTAKTR